MRKFANEKYFQDELAVLKSLITIEPTIVQKKNKKASDDEDSIEIEPTFIDYLILFHKLDKNAQSKVMKVHTGNLGYNISAPKYGTQVGKFQGNQLIGCYSHHFPDYYWKKESRNKRKNEIYKTYIKDVILN